MSGGDVVGLVGYLVAAWSVGFGAGYILTKYREAMNATG